MAKKKTKRDLHDQIGSYNEFARQMIQKTGPIYKKWKTRWEAATGLKVGVRKQRSKRKAKSRKA